MEALNEDDAKNFGGVPEELRAAEKNLINDIKLYKSKLLQAEKFKDSVKIKAFNDLIFEKGVKLDELKTENSEIDEQLKEQEKARETLEEQEEEMDEEDIFAF